MTTHLHHHHSAAESSQRRDTYCEPSPTSGAVRSAGTHQRQLRITVLVDFAEPADDVGDAHDRKGVSAQIFDPDEPVSDETLIYDVSTPAAIMTASTMCPRLL